MADLPSSPKIHVLRRRPASGVRWALASALLLGFTPIFGKQAISAGMAPLTVVALRTAAAAILVLIALVLLRRDLTIYPVGLLGCFVAGTVNGVGSLLYYAGLARLDAGLAQMLYGLYPLFVAAFLYLDGQRHGRLVLLGLALSVPATYLLTQTSHVEVDTAGVGMMLGAGFLFAVHIPFNERVLYEVPAPTVTFYTLLAMTAVVVPAAMLGSPWRQSIPAAAALPLVGLTAVTFLSRLALFSGVKSIGGLKTTLLGLAELVVALTVAHFWLGEGWTLGQIAGGALLAMALWLAGLDRPRLARDHRLGILWWLRPPMVEGVASEARQAAARQDPGLVDAEGKVR
ncbi:MAG TPA: DMT family transporter [Anaerolineales bacterium]|nr:DMT family transporter [Anaerolineales bacterium]